MVESFGKSLKDFSTLPKIDDRLFILALELLNDSNNTRNNSKHGQINVWRNISILQAEKLRQESNCLVNTLNVNQKNAFNIIIGLVNDAEGKNNKSNIDSFTILIYTNIFIMKFLDAPAGCGKTYLENVILKYLRGNYYNNGFFIGVATSGIASMLLEDGATAHSVFKIPLQLDANSCCHISKQGILAKNIKKLKLLIWDEVPMIHRFVVEAIDRSFQDILQCTDPFGGVTVLFAGDFRQIPPVVVRRKRVDIVDASFANSTLYLKCLKLKFTTNMRVIEKNSNFVAPGFEQIGNKFSEWLLAVSEGIDFLILKILECLFCKIKKRHS